MKIFRGLSLIRKSSSVAPLAVAVLILQMFCTTGRESLLYGLQSKTDDSAEALPALIGKSAPDFVVTTLDGRHVSLSSFKGKAVLINFWATWCGACRLEMPWLAQLREQYASQGFEVLGIVTDGASDEKVKQTAEKYGVKYPLLRCNHATAQAYGGLAYLPSSFYVDKSGKVTVESTDASSKGEVEADIRKTLGMRAK